MSNRLFEYYRDELRYLYKQGREFSKVHGDEASLLDFERDAREDPFVRRLVEAFAFLTARVQMKQDDDFPQISSALLEKLLPLATRPFPAFSIVQFQPSDQAKPGGQFLPRNETRLTLESDSDIQVRTCYDSRCYAISIVSCELKRNFPEARHASAKPAVSALKLVIEGNERLALDSALHDKLLLYISDRDIQFELCEFIYNALHREAIGFQTENDAWEISPDQLRILGFEKDELVLPLFSGLPMEYQLLMELFAYPTKHLFFELPIPEGLRKSPENRFELYIYFNTSNERLESIVGNQSLAVNCAPVVNLFEPQPLARPISKYCVDSLIDANSGDLDFEIFDLQTVSGIDEDGVTVPIVPFYSVNHQVDSSNSLFYSSRRDFRPRGDGTDILLSLVDLELEPASDSRFTQVLVKPVCCNRVFRDLNLVAVDSSSFRVLASGLVKSAKRVGDWSRMLIPKDNSRHYWKLISLLNLNFLFLEESRKVETLRRLLELLDRPSTVMNQSWIESVVRVETQRVTDRIDSRPWGSIADGTAVEVGLNEIRSSNRPGSWYLFSLGLSRFFALHAGINSFTQVSVFAAEDNRLLTKFSKRCGTRKLI